jgi:hypothetical protein
MAYAPGNVLTDTDRRAIIASNRARKGKPVSTEGRTNIAAANRLRAEVVDNLAGYHDRIDFTDLDERLVDLRLHGMSWQAIGDRIGVCANTARSRMAFLVQSGHPGALLTRGYSKRMTPIALKRLISSI